MMARNLSTSLLTAFLLGAALATRPHQEERQGRNLLDWIGLGTGPDTDPYLASANAACLNGDLAECFKSRALATFDDFFVSSPNGQQLTDHARILRMPDAQLRTIMQEPYEYSESPRADEPEWDQLVKFVSRRVEKFLKSSALEVTVDGDVTEQGRYTPRFIDEIADEIDLIEDKRDTLFNRKKLKKLFIPLLLVLKIFKLKLLLFLPLILGLASFKKFLGFLAIVVPGAIAYFKLCKPNFQSAFGHYPGHQNVPQYSAAGIGYRPHLKEPLYEPDYGQEYFPHAAAGYNKGALAFRDSAAQSLAYSNYYRSNNNEDTQSEVSTKKSILPDAK